MRILQVITGLKKAAGTTTFVENVVRELRALGHVVEVITQDAQLTALTGHVDIVHIHGLWSPLLHHAADWAAKSRVPVVWSTHGMSAPWSMRHKWWKKFPAWHLYQKRDLRRAALVHCTTDLEADWNHRLGFEQTFVAPLGTDLPPPNQFDANGAATSLPFRVLFVGRIYPVKGLMNLVRAVAVMKDKGVSTNELELRIVGPDQAGHQDELTSLARRLEVADFFRWPGPKFGTDLAAEYDSCSVLVLPSFTENFGGVVIDALARSKPVIASRFTPWQALENAACGWWVDNSPEHLAAAIAAAMALSPDRLRRMGEAGRSLVERDYAWSAIAGKLVSTYGTLVERMA